MGKTSFHGKRGFPLPPNPLPFSRKAEYFLLPLVANINNRQCPEFEYFLLPLVANRGETGPYPVSYRQREVLCFQTFQSRGFPLPPNPLPFSRKAEYFLLPLVANRGETVHTPFHIGSGRYYAFKLSRASIARSIAPRWQEMADKAFLPCVSRNSAEEISGASTSGNSASPQQKTALFSLKTLRI